MIIVDFSSCVDQVFDFTTAFLFALEGQTTIGYGFRSTTEECPIAIVLQFIQFLTAIALDSLVVTIVFTKVHTSKIILELDPETFVVFLFNNFVNSLQDQNTAQKRSSSRRKR